MIIINFPGEYLLGGREEMWQSIKEISLKKNKSLNRKKEETTEVGIYKRKQELDQESDQENKKKEIKNSTKKATKKKKEKTFFFS